MLAIGTGDGIRNIELVGFTGDSLDAVIIVGARSKIDVIKDLPLSTGLSPVRVDVDFARVAFLDQLIQIAADFDCPMRSSTPSKKVVDQET